METRTTKEMLEKGIVISKEGGIREFKSFQNISEGELVLKFTPDGIKSVFKNGSSVLRAKEGIFFSKTASQAQFEAVLVHFYYTVLLMEKKIRV